MKQTDNLHAHHFYMTVSVGGNFNKPIWREVLVSGFTGFVWTEGRFVLKKKAACDQALWLGKKAKKIGER